MERFKREPGTAQVSLCFRFTKEEAARVRAAGVLAGPTLTEWGRQLLLEAADKRLAQEESAGR